MIAHTPEFVFDDLEQYLPLNTGRQLKRWQAQEMLHRWFKFAAQELVEEYLLPVEDVAIASTPTADVADVQRVRGDAEAAPLVTETQLTAQQYFERAVEKGELDAGIADYDRAIELDPNYAVAFYNRGGARQAKGDLAGAIAD